MNLQEAKSFLTKLESEGLMYHLDDDAVDCLNQVTTQERAEQIQKTVNEIYSASLDWGEYECPIGYCIYLTKFSLFNYMADILDNFYTKNNLEHCCALESLIGGNYENEEQKAWLVRFGEVWDRVEQRELHR